LEYFAQVRQLATNGFRDSLGLAASSYGWEGRAELNRTNYARAIEHYTEALGAHDPTATTSLRLTISEALEKDAGALITLATNKLAQRVVTAHLISRFRGWGISGQFEAVGSRPTELKEKRPAELWLEALEAAEVNDAELADQIALAFYQAGRMEEAQRWIRRAPARSLVAQWLQAKLFLRGGELDRAAKLLAKLAAVFPIDPPEGELPNTLSQNVSFQDMGSWWRPIEDQLWSELGVLQLSRREYAEALDILLRHGFERDAAYVAERVLSLEELRAYVDRNFPTITPETDDRKTNESVSPSRDGRLESARQQSIFIRGLLGRRLMRSTLFEDAKPYFSEELQGKVDAFVSAWDTGHDTSNPQPERAAAFWQAANLIQTNGFELVGSITEPWWSCWGAFHHFEDSPLTRMTNSAVRFVPPSSDELRRVARNAPDHRRRFSYHYIAADLAWKAAVLMPNNSDETAYLLHTAGSWIKVLDQYEADRFYKSLVRRCRKTALGDAADKKRWFLRRDENGEIIWPEQAPPPERIEAAEEEVEAQ
jgi:tetratricopeptide (TPR) repeat protein